MKVRVKLLPLEQVKDPQGHKLLAMNMECLAVAAKLRADHEHLRCDRHPYADNRVIIEVLEEGNIHVHRAGLCCEEFASKLLQLLSVQ